jgi:hypothetical protein
MASPCASTAAHDPASSWDAVDAGEDDAWGDAGAWGGSKTPAAVDNDVLSASLASLSLVAPVTIPAGAVASPTCVTPACFAPIELEWFDEPSGGASALASRASSLLQRFLAEGDPDDVAAYVRCADDVITTAGAAAGGSGGSEGYERLPSSQKHLLNFQETLARAPSQCVRYTHCIHRV